jgi:hypothetical protein
LRLLTASLFVLVAAGCSAATPDVAPAVETRTAPEAAYVAPPPPKKPARGLEERVNGVRVVHLTGTPEEMGTQMGEICGEDIRYLLESNLKKIPWVAKDLAGAVAKAKLRAAGIPEEQMRELRATAKAARVDEDWLLVAASVIEIVEETRACAAVAAWGTATPAHETIVGRNLDWHDIGALHSRGLLIVRHPEKGHAFVSCGFPGIPGVLTGMNDAGVFTADLVQFAKTKVPPKDDGIPVMSLQRLALERSATAEEAAALYESSPRTVPQNYIVADAAGAAFLEADSQKLSRRAPCGDTVAGTNWAQEERGKLKGDVRFGNLCACIDPKVGALGVPEIEAALGAAGSGPLSVMSVVALPARRALRVSIGSMPACKGPFVDVDAGALMDKDVR